MRVLLVDFDDSFTYNIYAELSSLNIMVTICHWRSFSHHASEYENIILGPGPGHILEYKNIFSIIKNEIKKKKYFFGICLGHQILCHLKGHKIIKMKYPLHGESLDIYWPGIGPLRAQFYNSWEVQSIDSDVLIKYNDFVIGSKGKTFLTYQFHPESVGTFYRKYFFKSIIENCYNSYHDEEISNRWNL